MRILTLVAGPDALPDATRLWDEIRAFNRTIDFRLRFLHIDIGGALVVPDDVATDLDETDGVKVHAVAVPSTLAAAASMAMLLDRERPALLIVLGSGPLSEAGIAAAQVAGTRLAAFGEDREGHEGALDLGDDAKLAVERMSGVAKELG